MPSFVRASIAVLCCSCATACGQDGQALPTPVRAALDQLTMQCSEVGGTPHADDAVHTADLDADGNDDFVLFAGWITCENAWSIYGDREKLVMVFAGDADASPTEAFSGSAFDIKIERDAGRAELWLTTLGESCGRPAAPSFAEETFCERRLERGPSGLFDYAPLDTVRLIE